MSHKQAQRVLDALAQTTTDAAEILELAARAIPEWKIYHSRVGDGSEPWRKRWRVKGRRGAPRTGVANAGRSPSAMNMSSEIRSVVAREMVRVCPAGGLHEFQNFVCGKCRLRRD